MKVKVMKFGGTSLKSVVTREYVYGHIKKYSDEYKIILVVSAMGRYPNPFSTDTLLSYASTYASKEEKAWLASIGEQYSALRISSELQNLGYKARAVHYVEAGIVSDDRYEYGDVLYLDDTHIKKYLEIYDIVVVGGFLAMNKDYKVTTLGRGGSDYSAVLFAHMMHLKEVEIYSDVDGVYDKDPNISSDAKKYTQLSYDEMLNLKSRVLEDRCVNYAKKKQIKIHLLGTFSDNAGTFVQ